MTETSHEVGRSGFASSLRYIADVWRSSSIPEGLRDAPFDLIFAEHHRQREAAAMLSSLADGGFDLSAVEALIEFLEFDFARHILEEESLLFPALIRACRSEDSIDQLVMTLSEQHRKHEALAEATVGLLKRLAGGAVLTVGERERLRQFSTHIRQHLALENSVLLPIAHVRLTAADQACLAGQLAANRRNAPPLAPTASLLRAPAWRKWLASLKFGGRPMAGRAGRLRPGGN